MSYNEYLLHHAAMHLLETGEYLTYEQVRDMDLEWRGQVNEMARWIVWETDKR